MLVDKVSDYKDISNIYIYRVLGVFVNFGSMFIVVPFLASDPESYAIYAFAMSLSFFLTYGDLGFVGAAQKYCAEAVGRGRLEQELEYVGFMVAVLGIVAGLFASLMIMAAFNPQVLLPQLDQKHVKYVLTVVLLDLVANTSSVHLYPVRMYLPLRSDCALLMARPQNAVCSRRWVVLR